ncbi:MAG: peptidylprolyl isomerase [Deltaproteobacteria bacterium]|nr:peptidylprolyl isomerase [Deltaproteobacteria bacterium]
MSQAAVANDHVVEIHYTLKDDDGDVVDSSVGGDPLDYLHGHGGIVPGLEAAMAGKKVGDKFAISVPPAEGYGEVTGEPKSVPKSAFPDDVELEEGMQFFVSGKDGDPIPVWVVAVHGDEVLLDQNHPLAGETLHFEIEVVSVRKASAEELEHGHPHGPEGHHHH